MVQQKQPPQKRRTLLLVLGQPLTGVNTIVHLLHEIHAQTTTKTWNLLSSQELLLQPQMKQIAWRLQPTIHALLESCEFDTLDNDDDNDDDDNDNNNTRRTIMMRRRRRRMTRTRTRQEEWTRQFYDRAVKNGTREAIEELLFQSSSPPWFQQVYHDMNQLDASIRNVSSLLLLLSSFQQQQQQQQQSSQSMNNNNNNNHNDTTTNLENDRHRLFKQCLSRMHQHRIRILSFLLRIPSTTTTTSNSHVLWKLQSHHIYNQFHMESVGTLLDQLLSSSTTTTTTTTKKKKKDDNNNDMTVIVVWRRRWMDMVVPRQLQRDRKKHWYKYGDMSSRIPDRTIPNTVKAARIHNVQLTLERSEVLEFMMEWWFRFYQDIQTSLERRNIPYHVLEYERDGIGGNIHHHYYNDDDDDDDPRKRMTPIKRRLLDILNISYHSLQPLPKSYPIRDEDNEEGGGINANTSLELLQRHVYNWKEMIDLWGRKKKKKNNHHHTKKEGDGENNNDNDSSEDVNVDNHDDDDDDDDDNDFYDDIPHWEEGVFTSPDYAWIPHSEEIVKEV